MTNGSLDRKVYIRRRIIVLLVIAAAIATVVLVIVKPGAGSGERSAAQVDLPADLEIEKDPEAAPNCSAAQLTVTPITSQGSYDSDEKPQLSLSVKNTGDSDCVADLGTAHMYFVVSSGNDEVWRSADCQKKAEVRPVILAPGETLTTENIEWDRTRSDPKTCDEVRDPVSGEGSTYHLSVTVAGVQSQGTAAFLLY